MRIVAFVLYRGDICHKVDCAILYGTVTLSGANFVETNIQLANDTLHVIDTVLNP